MNKVLKTFRLSKEVLSKIEKICLIERRTKTNVISIAIEDYYLKIKEKDKKNIE
jgi:predicted transcriptional regulator